MSGNQGQQIKSLKQITTEDLRRMDGQEGLILQGCGGGLQEWVDGINDILTEEGILLDGSRFEEVSVFQHQGLTNLLFPFDGVKLDVGKLAVWRLQTHGQFGGTWLPTGLGDTLRNRSRESPPCAWRAGTGIFSASWAGPPAC